jgi:coproporphyrinogen III oxidase
MIDIESIKQYLLGLQSRISDALMQMDENLVLREDEWQL